MAIISEFHEAASSDRGVAHPTKVECGYHKIITQDGVLLQLSTYGSDDRQSEKKVSQTFQLDQERAAELIKIIRSVFPGLG
jgi:hypothetical protein